MATFLQLSENKYLNIDRVLLMHYCAENHWHITIDMDRNTDEEGTVTLDAELTLTEVHALVEYVRKHAVRTDFLAIRDLISEVRHHLVHAAPLDDSPPVSSA